MPPFVGWLLQTSRQFAAVGLVAVVVYANTLWGDFTFDDNFAVITNGDVTKNNPAWDLFKHDFWGQDITSSQSHKSYRPFTVLAFRLTHRFWGVVTAAAPGITQLLPALSAAPDSQNGKGELAPGLHPFPFHVLSVAMHAVASMLVLALCQHMFAMLETICTQPATQSIPAPSSQQHSAPSSCPEQHGVISRAWWRQLLMVQEQPKPWRVPCSTQYRAQALLAGLMFALHPIHTEAVAGIVGCAELICAVLSCPALLCYFLAADGRYAAAQQLQQPPEQKAGGSTETDSAAAKTPASTGRAARQRQVTLQAQASGSCVATGTTHGQLHTADAVQHWMLVLAAAVLALCAAFSKEIGITVIGTMLLYDMLLAPSMRLAGAQSGEDSSRQPQQVRPAACRRQLLRMVSIAAVAVGYVRLRQWVAVKQLVDIYRKVENPIPFAESPLTRTLSTGYLHARYAWLLVMPLHLSADWSFNCIPLVEHLSDARNCATVIMYCYILYTIMSAQPLCILRQLWELGRGAVGLVGSYGVHISTHAHAVVHASNGSGPATPASTTSMADDALKQATAGPQAAAESLDSSARARWRLMVLIGLVVAPFFPASNVLFYVGTFIGERLLYSPSIGFCMLAVEALGAALPGTWMPGANARQQKQQQPCDSPELDEGPLKQADADQQAWRQGSGPGSGQSQQDSSSCNPSACSWGVLLLVVLLLGGYAGRTVLRNMDWRDDEHLFLSALQVCPQSAKVQLNCGVLQRRFLNYTGAYEHFRLAQEIEPGYCEPTYWMGLTTLNLGQPVEGVAVMNESLSCRFTASEALTALNKVYLMMMEANKGTNLAPMVEWAEVLASPHVLRIADACSTAEDAALGAALAGKGEGVVSTALDACLQGIHYWQHGYTEADSLAALSKQQGTNVTLLGECVKMRGTIYKQLMGHTVSSAPVRRAVYRYIQRIDKQWPACRSHAGGGPLQLGPEGQAEGARLPPSHQKLLHKVQASDPEDPWLHYEWGMTLLALDPPHFKEASMHLEVSAALFTQASQDLLEVEQPANNRPTSGQPRGKQLLQLTQLDSKTLLTPLTALQAAMQPLMAYQDAAVGITEPAVVARACELLQRLCHVRLQAATLLDQQRQKDLAGGVSSTQAQIHALQEAALAAQRCLQDLSGRPACAQHANQLRKNLKGLK